MTIDSNEIVLDVQGLTVDIKTPRGVLHVVRDISLQVKRGETLCIVGESGCGKSSISLSSYLRYFHTIKANLVFNGRNL